MTSLVSLFNSVRSASSFVSPRHKVASGAAALFVVSVVIALTYIAPVVRSAAPPLQFSTHGYPLGLMDKDKVSGLAPHVMVLPRFSWSNQTDADADDTSGTTIVPVLVIKDPALVERICDYGPNMIGIIKQIMARVVPTLDPAQPDTFPEALSTAGHAAAETINTGLGKVWLREIYLLHDVSNPVRVAAKSCQILK